jgi:large subunit ribosomal protein L17
MRHRVAGRKLHRTTSHRLAMLNNMVTSLLEHERIETTLQKAKEARRMAEKVITLGKRGGLANVRLAARVVKSKDVLAKTFGDLATRFKTRPGGYTRIVRLGFRRGDAAEIALLELVDRGEPKAAEGEGEKAAAAPKKAKAAPKAKKTKAEAAE